jgi:hypothetical protein
MTADLLTFLERFRPDGCITFVGIVPDGSTVAETFNGADPRKAASWLMSQNQARNVYFTVNPTLPGTRRKPTKDDITAVASLWGDVDPLDSKGRSWAAERKRMLALADELVALEWPPSLIIDSGSGIQPIWSLSEPIEATPEYRDAAEALCARIEAALGAKGTHNVDRLLRVPGTRNFPNTKKRTLGRGETQARLLHASWRRYGWRDLEDLATRLEQEPLEHAEPVEPGDNTKSASAADLNLPNEPPDPLEPERLKELRTRHPDLFDLARYDGDQSRQDLALASLARRIGWPPVDAWRLIIAIRGDAKARRRDYAARTIGRAYARVESGKDQLVFDPKDPLPIARAFVAIHYQHEDGRTLHHYRSAFYSWTGTYYTETTETALRARLYDLLGNAKRVADNQLKPFMPTSARVSDVLDALKAVAHLQDCMVPPIWLAGEGAPANEVLACRNGLLHLPTRRIAPATPLFFGLNSVEFGFDPSASEPEEWTRFLDALWRDDAEAIDCLQEIFGYLLTTDTRQQKAFLLVGPKRSGKGTIARVLKALLGSANVAGPTLDPMFAL